MKIAAIALLTFSMLNAQTILTGVSPSIGGFPLSAGGCFTQPVTISGAAVASGNSVTPNPRTFPGNGVTWEGYISAANTVTLKICSSISQTPVSSIYDITVQQPGSGGSGVTSVTATAPITSSGGATPNISATYQGNGAKVQASTGTTTTNDCVKFDANGNTIDSGAPCGTGSGTVTSVTATGPLTSSGGVTPNISATYQGNGAKVQASTGTTTTNDCVKFDAAGNTIDAGAACGTVTSVTATGPITSSGGATPNISATYQGNGAKVQASTGTTTTNDCVKFDGNGNTIDSGAACGVIGTAGTFFLSTTGSDSNSCTSSGTACATLAHIEALMPAFISGSYTINVANGTYAQCPEFANFSSPSYGFTNSPSTVTLLGNDASPSSVVFTGTCTFTSESVGTSETAGLYAHTAANIIIDGITISPTTSTTEGLKADGMRRIVIKNCNFSGSITIGLVATGPSQITLTGTVNISNFTIWGLYTSLTAATIISNQVTLNITPNSSTGATGCMHAELNSTIDIEGGSNTITCGDKATEVLDADTNAAIFIGLNINAVNSSGTPANSAIYWPHRGGTIFDLSTITATNWTNQCKATEPAAAYQGPSGRTFTNVGGSSTTLGGTCIFF